MGSEPHAQCGVQPGNNLLSLICTGSCTVILIQLVQYVAESEVLAVLQEFCCICWTLPSAWRSRCSQLLSAMCRPARAPRWLPSTSTQTPTPLSSLFRYGAHKDSDIALLSRNFQNIDVPLRPWCVPGDRMEEFWDAFLCVSSPP